VRERQRVWERKMDQVRMRESERNKKKERDEKRKAA